MRITATGLMELLLMNSEIPVQNRDGVCSIVHAAILNVPTQTQLVDVHLASVGVLFMSEQTRYRLVQSIMTL